LFTADWVQELKQKLKTFISSNSEKLGLKQPAQTSKLYGIYKDFTNVVGGGTHAKEELANESLSDRLK